MKDLKDSLIEMDLQMFGDGSGDSGDEGSDGSNEGDNNPEGDGAGDEGSNNDIDVNKLKQEIKQEYESELDKYRNKVGKLKKKIDEIENEKLTEEEKLEKEKEKLNQEKLEVRNDRLEAHKSKVVSDNEIDDRLIDFIEFDSDMEKDLDEQKSSITKQAESMKNAVDGIIADKIEELQESNEIIDSHTKDDDTEEVSKAKELAKKHSSQNQRNGSVL